jgi:hypothetical protein
MNDGNDPDMNEEKPKRRTRKIRSWGCFGYL